MTDDRPVIVETPARSAGAGWAVALVMVGTLIIGAVFVTQISNGNASGQRAIANAAQDVGQAARDVGSRTAAGGGAK